MLRLARDLAPAHRTTQPRHAGNRRRPVGRWRDRLHPPARGRTGAPAEAAVLARPGPLRVQRAAAGPRLRATPAARPLSRRLARDSKPSAARSAAAPRLDRAREDAGDG